MKISGNRGKFTNKINNFLGFTKKIVKKSKNFQKGYGQTVQPVVKYDK